MSSNVSSTFAFMCSIKKLCECGERVGMVCKLPGVCETWELTHLLNFMVLNISRFHQIRKMNAIKTIFYFYMLNRMYKTDFLDKMVYKFE